jgi:hypothetical protein
MKRREGTDRNIERTSAEQRKPTHHNSLLSEESSHSKRK